MVVLRQKELVFFRVSGHEPVSRPSSIKRKKTLSALTSEAVVVGHGISRKD